MNREDFIQRAALTALPECIRIIFNDTVIKNIGNRIETTDAIYKATDIAERIAVFLCDKIEEYDPEVIKKKQSEKEEWIRELLAYPISYFTRSNRIRSLLLNAGYRTVADLVKSKKEDLRSIKGVGGRTITDLEDLLERNDLYFGMDISKYE